MQGHIVEVWFPHGIALNTKHGYGDQAFLQYQNKRVGGMHRILAAGIYDLTPNVPFTPNIEHELLVFENGTAELHSILLLNSNNRMSNEVSSNDDNNPSESRYVRSLNPEIPEQTITGLNNETMLLFAYLFFTYSTEDSRLVVLEWIRQQRRLK